MDFNLLSKDIYFWIAIGLFVLSAIGVVVILKALKKDSHTSSDIFLSKDNSFAAMTSSVGTSSKEANPNFEILARELSRVVDTLVRIESKIEKSKGMDIAKLSDELKNLTQTLGETTTKINSDQLNNMSGKIDKVYQVLHSVSDTYDKQGS